MAKSEALLHAEKTIDDLRLEIKALQEQADISINRDEEIERLLAKIERRQKRFDDLKNRSHNLAQKYLDTVLALAAMAVRRNKDCGDGPFNCAGLVDFDPEHIFEYFAEKIPGGDHWQKGETKTSAVSGGMTFP